MFAYIIHKLPCGVARGIHNHNVKFIGCGAHKLADCVHNQFFFKDQDAVPAFALFCFIGEAVVDAPP